MVEEPVRTEGLARAYDTVTALDGVDWSVSPGAACALLGPNGAGKTTLLKLLLGFIPPSRGCCSVLGMDSWELDPDTRSRIGYVPERPFLPQWMRVREILQLHASLYPGWDEKRKDDLISLFDIPVERTVNELSKGQNQYLMILLAVCGSPDLLLLDEPASGLDPAARRQLFNLLGEYLADGERTVVLSSHLLSDVERFATDVAILVHGQLLRHRALDGLLDSIKCLRVAESSYHRVESLLEGTVFLERQKDRDRMILTVEGLSPERLQKLGNFGVDVEVLNLSLEDIYLVLTKPKADQAA
jgi:ABC-2 type transport system ATP-binding protein